MKIEKITSQIAALYLGQKCESTNGASFQIASASLWGVTDGDRYRAPFEGLKLHLRRLESMTEDEAREVYRIFYGSDPVRENALFSNKKQLFAIVEGINEPVIYGFIGCPRVWLHLLSKGFDLFGLIDAGLAKEIDTPK